ncbi:MAG: agmatine deiminase family protein [Candidatus Diapherotrites archaeon]|nr:agmatine deiminase family protein [Candidatus Diapherotrites archaeon]
MKTPQQENFHMPAEWNKHEATWLSWPKDPDTFSETIIQSVENIYSIMISELSQGEIVNVLAENSEMKEKIEKLIKEKKAKMKNVKVHLIKSIDVWARDYGPTFLLNKKTNQLGCTKWIFNAWGNKYKELLMDNQTGERIAQISKAQTFKPEIVMEGGSIEVNGTGTVLVTEQCQLNKNRNPKLKKQEIENYLKEYLHVSNIVWLKEGIEGDDTDGHIDDIARFVNENTIVYCMEENRKDKNFEILKENQKILEKAVNEKGQKFKLIPLPMPKAMWIPGRRLAASYANFYIANASVLVPIYDKSKDSEVLKLFKKLFPKKKIVGINCTDLVYGYGSIHCVTQQQPAIK